MIIKTLSRRAEKQSFKQLIEYVDRQDKRTATAQLFDPEFRVYFNLQGIDKEEIISEFQENFEKYKPKRKNGVGAYHEILSWKKEDSLHLTQEAVEDLALTYLQSRSPKGLCYGALHTDRDHIHLHLVISGNELKSKRANRLSQEDFLEVRRSIEAYQKEQYPRLTSVAYDDLKPKRELRQTQDRNTRREKLHKVEGRDKSQKSQMAGLLTDAIRSSNNAREFYEKLIANECTPYVYRNKVNGIIKDGKKYRFTTLVKAIKDEKVRAECSKKLEVFRRLEMLRQVREKELGQDLDLSDDFGLSL